MVFQPSDSWTNISFASEQTFSTVTVDATGVTFDGVRLGVVKTPASLPRADLTIAAWSPRQTVENGTVLRFDAEAPADSTVVFALSNLTPAREYVLEVDEVEWARTLSNAAGNVSFQWSNWSVHDFHVLLGWRTGLPPALSADFTFSPENPIVGESVAFSATASGGTEPYGYVWDFGDGGTGTGASTTHAYAAVDAFNVTLTVSDATGTTSAVTKPVTVVTGSTPSPLFANFTHSPVAPAVGQTVSFSAAASGGTSPYVFQWEFGDGASADGQTASHEYGASGTFAVTLTVTDGEGNATEVTRTLEVRPQGGIVVAFDYSVSGSTVTFVDHSSSDGGSPITTRFWSFGDGATSTEARPVHTYGLSGFSATYTVLLVACDSAGNCGSARQDITLLNLPLLLYLVLPVAVGIGLLAVVWWRGKRGRETADVARPQRANGGRT